MLRKRHRDNKERVNKEEEEAKRPKNFGLKMVEEVEEKDKKEIQRAKQIQSINKYKEHKIEAREQIRQQSIFGGNNKDKVLDGGLRKIPIDIK